MQYLFIDNLVKSLKNYITLLYSLKIRKKHSLRGWRYPNFSPKLYIVIILRGKILKVLGVILQFLFGTNNSTHKSFLSTWCSEKTPRIWGGNWRGKTVQSHLQTDIWWGECAKRLRTRLYKHDGCLFYISWYVKYCSYINQDMQVCANELKIIMTNVLSKREYTERIIFWLCVKCCSLLPSCVFPQIVK